MSGGITLIISDVHTQFHVINSQIENAENFCGQAVSGVFVLGDFGFFSDKMRQYFRKEGHRFLRPVACIDGNHEDHGALPGLAIEYADVLQYVPRGKLHQLDPWQGLCLGGASYMDSFTTPRGAEISPQDVQRCLAHGPEDVDLILSHDCPSGIGVPGAPGMQHYGPPGEPQLTLLAEGLSPRWWFFGHHHRWFDMMHEGTRYLGLPESWVGYALLHEDGQVDLIRHQVARNPRPWWRRWLGPK